jgi:MoaA/NifB/PqqE/SkfB family radical SAM enzyme
MAKPSIRRTYHDLELAARVGASALDPDRPVLCFLTVTRRCNLSCGYCFEYDDVSPEVPYDGLVESIGHLARLKTVMVTLNGGEPLLHSRVPDLVRHLRSSRSSSSHSARARRTS